MNSSDVESSRSRSMDPAILGPRREDLEKWSMEVPNDGDGLIDPRGSNESSERTSNHGIPDYAENVSQSIEDGIKERNRAFEMLKTNSHKDVPLTKSQAATEKATLYAVPVEQLNLKVMNPEATNVCVDIVAVHGLGM
jgi:hypothetical protein